MISLGVVGVGKMGEAYLKASINNPLVKLISVCDVNRKLAKEVGETYGVKNYDSYEEMYSNEELDAVVIATPDFSHKEPVVCAAKNKFNMIVEKPLAMKGTEGREMVDAVKKAGVIGQMAYIFRWLSPYLVAKEAIDRGELGDILSVNVQMNDRIFVPTKMLKWASDSSPSWFLLSHTIDVARWFSGKEAKKVYATGVKKKLFDMGIDTQDIVKANITFEKGMEGSFEANWIIPDKLPVMAGARFVVTGTEGTIYIDSHDQMVWKISKEFEMPSIFNHNSYGTFAGLHRNMLNTFAETVMKGKPSVVTLEDGYKVTAILEAMDKSIISGEPENIKY